MKLKILDLAIQESYFTGRCGLDGKEYFLNIQNQSGGKIAKFPFSHDNDIVSLRLSGVNLVIQDELKFKGHSEWIEIYSDLITNYLANNQQGLEWLEIGNE